MRQPTARGLTPLARARACQAAGIRLYPYELVLLAVGPWSPKTNVLRSPAERARAAAVMRAGYHISFRRPGHGAIREAWLEHVMPFVGSFVSE